VTYGIGIDVGGTFTDFVAEGGPSLVKGKVPSLPGDEARSVMEALEQIAAAESVPLAHLLRETETLVLGTTVVLNTMLEHDGATTGLITNRGFRDIIELRRGHKESQFDLRLEAPFPIVPRELRRTVTGRIDRDGRVVDELDETEVRNEIAFLKDRNVSSIAVCMLFSFVNQVHERRVSEIVRELYPDCHISLSCDVLPQVREFDRLSTTLVNAYTSPKLASYI